MRNFTRNLTAAALLSTSVVAMADSPHEFSANVALTSNYVYRGITQTNEGPAIQGGFDYSYAPVGFYAGIWASNLDFNAGTNDNASIEIDYYAGFAGEFSNAISWDVGGIYYHYPDQDEDKGAEYDFFEAYGNVGYTFAGVAFEPTIGMGLAYSPDFFGEDDTGLYVSGTLDLSLPQGFGLSFLVGNQDVDGDKSSGPNGFEYSHYSIGVSKDIGSFGFDLTWYDIIDDDDICTGDDDACESLVFTVSSSW